MTFDRHRLAIVCSEPRLLIVLAHTQICRFAIIVAHAPTSTTPDAERHLWWDHLDARLAGLPPAATPVICCDANARFRRHEGCEVPSNANAERLQAILVKYQLCRTRSYAPDGALYTTWRSPQGCPACLDYILVPQAWEAGLTTVSNLGLLDMHAGIDHDVLGADLRLDLPVPSRRGTGIDRDSMLTPQGRLAVANLFANAPVCSWAMNSDDHLQQLHAYLLQGARTLFPRRPPAPDVLYFRSRRGICCICADGPDGFFGDDGSYFCVRNFGCFSVDGAAFVPLALPFEKLAPLPRTMTTEWHNTFASCSSSQSRCAFLPELMRHSYAREHLNRARRDGPKAMATAIRAVLKHGRRYKPPTPATTLRLDSGEVLSDEASVKAAFGQFFAKSEKASPCPFAELAHAGAGPKIDRIVVDALPSAVDLASALQA